jgi:hypothetical protein
VIAGRGHETEQLIGRRRVPLRDCDVARRAHGNLVPREAGRTPGRRRSPRGEGS